MTTSERIAVVARRIVRECAAVRPGDDVYIEGRVDSADYLELLAFECELVGARPLVVMVSDRHNSRRLLELPEEQLATLAAPWVEAVKAADVVFTIRLEDGEPQLFAGVTPAQRGANRRGRKLLADLICDGTRRWVGSDFPTAHQVAAFGLEPERYFDLFWRALDVDYAELEARSARVCAVLEGAGEVRIITPKGTDVTMRIDGRPLERDVGCSRRAPCSPTCRPARSALRPSRNSADGLVVFDLAFWDGKWVEDLEVEFVGGVARVAAAARGLKLFNDTLANATGSGDVIGELGIGLNHEVAEPCGNLLLDEKILGTIHIAVGDNRVLGGVNESSLHWDLLVMKPTVTVDGTALLTDGDLVV